LPALRLGAQWLGLLLYQLQPVAFAGLAEAGQLGAEDQALGLAAEGQLQQPVDIAQVLFLRAFQQAPEQALGQIVALAFLQLAIDPSQLRMARCSPP